MAGLTAHLRDNFWIAYDSLMLKSNNTAAALRGIELAKEM